MAYQYFFTFLQDPMIASPVFVREFRSRMRHPWAYWVLTAYLALLMPAGLYFLYRFSAMFSRGKDLDEVLVNSQQVGLAFAFALFALQFVLITVLVPGLTCTGFTQERIKKQLVFLLLTPLSSRRIVIGKLLSGLFYVMLILLSTVPLCAISSQFGGLSPLDLVTGYATLAAYALLVAAFGLYVSAKDREGARAALWAYLGALGVPLLFPCLLLPLSALYNLVVLHDTLLLTQVSGTISIPATSLLFTGFFVLAALWFIGETAALLDTERRMWGTYPPPLPLHRLAPTPPVPAPEQPPVAEVMEEKEIEQEQKQEQEQDLPSEEPPAPKRKRW